MLLCHSKRETDLRAVSHRETRQQFLCLVARTPRLDHGRVSKDEQLERMGYTSEARPSFRR